MSDWQPMNTAPKNAAGEGAGPWLLAFSQWDHAVYQIRWECTGDKCGWRMWAPKSGVPLKDFTHWMPKPENPEGYR